MIKKIYKLYIALFIRFYSILNGFYIKVLKIEVLGSYNIMGKIFIRNSGKIIFGDQLIINSGFKYNPIGGQGFTSIVVGKDAILEIKENVGISNSSFFCSNKITIEENVLIGGDCKIYDTDFHSIFIKDRMKIPEEGVKTAPVTICKGAFIGGGSIILKGVTIGANSIIGAGSVVTKNIPANEIWAGNPVSFIKTIG